MFWLINKIQCYVAIRQQINHLAIKTAITADVTCPLKKFHSFVCCKYFYGILWMVYCLSCRLIDFFFSVTQQIFSSNHMFCMLAVFFDDNYRTHTKVYIDRITVWYFNWLFNTCLRHNLYPILFNFTNSQFSKPMTKD